MTDAIMPPGGRIMKRKRLSSCALAAALLLPVSVPALEMRSIIAYPVPFNPDRQTMKIGYEQGATPEALDSVSVQVFDINGDMVLSRSYTSLNPPVVWNGRNSAGIMVSPGMYIIKITAENSATGEHGKKIIRILVNR